MVNCDFKEKCTSRGYKCGSCSRNQKKDYYIPDYNPWCPPRWREPWYRPRRRYIYSGTSAKNDTGDYYVSG